MDTYFGIFYFPSGLTLLLLTIQSSAFIPSGMMKGAEEDRADSHLPRHLSREGRPRVFSLDPCSCQALTQFLLLRLAACPPRGLEAEPEAGRQDAKVPGSTPHRCPSFSGHPKGRGQLPSLLGKGRRESVEGAL